MIGSLDLLLRLTIWFLLTADFSLVNSLIGLTVVLLIPRSRIQTNQIKDWLRIAWEILIAIPQAYFEAIEMIFRPHLYEEIVVERVKPNRSLGLIFLDIFLITFTPKTIVMKHQDQGNFIVHRVHRQRHKRKLQHQTSSQESTSQESTSQESTSQESASNQPPFTP